MNRLELLIEFFGLGGRLGERRPIDMCDRTRADFAAFLEAAGCDRGCEVGVSRGVFSEVLLAANPRLHLLAVDPWVHYEGYQDFPNERLDEFYEQTCERLDGYWPRAVTLRGFSVDVARLIAPASLDFVYVDGNHSFDSCMEDLIWWGERVRPGGVIAGHDYIRRDVRHNYGVIQAVNAYTAAHGVDLFFTVGGYSRREVDGVTRRRGEPRTYFFVKP